ncbi:MAG: hypothetical protein QOK15_1992 [Nocardioidaceae bacterium]|jgi:hypothetical protein|nr:hypothetical protein [Nocardioidaceae bacterium]
MSLVTALLLAKSSNARASSRLLVRLGAPLAATALALTGCSSDRTSSASGDTTSPSPTASASTSASVPSGTEVTAPGTMLAFGDTATVPYQVGKSSTVLDLTVTSATQGSLADFQGFDMSEPYKHKGSYYYVRVAVKNGGEEKFGGVPVPLWGISDKGTLLQAVDFKSAFATCPTEGLPKDFKPKDRFETCLVYLSPNHGGLEGVSYRPTVDYQPIEWHGKVQKATTKTKSEGTKQ